MKKLFVILPVLLVFLLTPITTYAASWVSNPSISKYFYLEPGEYIGQGTAPDWTFQQSADRWDELIKGSLSSYTVIHMFTRQTYYDKDSKPGSSQDLHAVIRIPKSYGKFREDYEVLILNGRLQFQRKNSTLITYENISTGFAPGIRFDWSTLSPPNQGIVVENKVVNGYFDINIFDVITGPYDPTNPPPYSHPDTKNPGSGISPTPGGNNGGGGGSNNGFPVQPEPPDSAWDLIGWVKYIVDWIIYIVKCFVYFLTGLGGAIGEVVTGSAGFVQTFAQFFSFLPAKVSALFTIGVLSLIVVGIVRR